MANRVRGDLKINTNGFRQRPQATVKTGQCGIIFLIASSPVFSRQGTETDRANPGLYQPPDHPTVLVPPRESPPVWGNRFSVGNTTRPAPWYPPFANGPDLQKPFRKTKTSSKRLIVLSSAPDQPLGLPSASARFPRVTPFYVYSQPRKHILKQMRDIRQPHPPLPLNYRCDESDAYK